MHLVSADPVFIPTLEKAAEQALMMTSLEIAELTGKRHDNVKRTIGTLAKNNTIRFPQIEVSEEINNLGHSVPRERYLFAGEQGKRDSIIVVAQLSPEFTARLVDRWQELESQQEKPALPDFSDPVVAARAWADAKEAERIAHRKLTDARPKIEFVDRYVTATGSMTFRQVAKLLGAKEPEFRCFLIDNHIMYRLNNVMTPHAQHIDAGRFEVKTGTTQASNYAFTQARFTAKGVQWIGGLWMAHKAKGVNA